MKYILCYGDSNTWGSNPETGGRYEYEERWTGQLARNLGSEYHIYEASLGGRTTVFSDPIEEHRNGLEGFEITLAGNSPLDLIILMLGTNDTKIRFHNTVADIALGIELLIDRIRKSGCGRNQHCPAILIAAPVPFGPNFPVASLARLFDAESSRKSYQLAAEFASIAEREENCHFLDLGQVTAVSPADNLHLSRQGHTNVAMAYAQKIREILGE